MQQTLQNIGIGAFIGFLSGYIIQNYSVDTLKIFAFIWAAPLLLFIPLYVSYYKGSNYAIDFLNHAFLGSFLTLCVSLVTLMLIKINLLMALVANMLLSNGGIILYLCWNYIKKT
jgi:hypothetical protein